MAKYFFHFRSPGSSSIDEEGLVLTDMDAAHHVAVGALADGLREIVVQGGRDQQFTIEVHDEFGVVLHVRAVLESKLYRKQ